MRLESRWLRVATVATAVATAIATLGPAPVATAEPDQPAALAPPNGPAQAWLVADTVSGRILGGKDPYGQHAPASTIKALLAMVVLDQINPAAAVRATPSSTDVECSCVGLVPGAVYTTRQLLDALLMVSGNDAANLLGEMLGGPAVAVQKMNLKAAQVGARATRAGSPSGLDGPGWESITTRLDRRRPRCTVGGRQFRSRRRHPVAPAAGTDSHRFRRRTLGGGRRRQTTLDQRPQRHPLAPAFHAGEGTTTYRFRNSAGSAMTTPSGASPMRVAVASALKTEPFPVH
jgi:hypothetical protein